MDGKWQIRTTTTLKNKQTKQYMISGQLFFGTMSHFVDLFSFNDDPEKIIIDFSGSHVWDHSAVTAISKVIHKYQRLDKKVVIEGLNRESEMLIEQVGLSVPSGH